MSTPFKMKGWSPFTKLEEKKTFSTKEDQPQQNPTDNKESDITGSESISSKRTNALIKKHKGSASVDNPPPYIYGRGQEGLNYRKWRRQFVKGLKDQ